jgi:hypothetical protein
MSSLSSPGTNGRPSAQSLVTAAKEAVDHAKTLVRLELELAKLELTRKLTTLGVGIGLFVGAAVLSVFGIGFLLATIAAGLATFLPTWLALLIVTLAIFLIIAVLVQLGKRMVKKATPAMPEQAIAEAKLTKEVLARDAATH